MKRQRKKLERRKQRWVKLQEEERGRRSAATPWWRQRQDADNDEDINDLKLYHDKFHQSESWLNLISLIQQFPSSADSAAQDVDFEDEEEEDAVSVAGTNSNSELRSDSFLEFMAEQIPPLDSALVHEIARSKSPMYADVDSSKVASCSNSNDLVPLPLNSASSFSVLPVDFVSERTYYKSKPDLPCAALNQEFNVVNNTQFQPPIASTNGDTSYHNFADEFVSLQLNSTVTGAVSSAESYLSVPLPIAAATPPPAAVDFDNECTALNQVNPQFNVVNNTQFQPLVANANGVTSYYNFVGDFVPLSLNSAVTGMVSSPLPMAPPHPHAVDFNSEHAYYKSRPEISCVAANQVNQQFNIVNNTQSQPPIANTNVFQFTAKIIENSDEAKRQRRKQANLISARQSRKRRQDVMKNTEKEVEHLKNIALELSLACSKRKEKCDTSHRWNRVAIMDRVAIIARVYTFEKQLMRVTGFHPLDDSFFISIAKDAGLNLSDVRSLIHAPTYLTSPIPPNLNQLVSTFSNASHPQGQQVQNQNFLNTGLHGAMPS